MTHHHHQTVPKWLVIDGCPFPSLIAPFVAVLAQDTHQTVSSGYRGSDPIATAIMHRHGKHNQAELYHSLPPGYANRPGTSTHELFSDQQVFPHIPIGHAIPVWAVGVDSGEDTDHDRQEIQKAAAYHGWHVQHTYSAGFERHHYNFMERPHCKTVRMQARITHLRLTLPRS